MSGLTSPVAKASSMVRSSTCLIVTASRLIPITHAVSHGAGHKRPVNSGKLFVACKRSIASRVSPRQIKSFHSGMRLPSGHPSWQKGIPQSIQRPACFCRCSKLCGSYTSRQSWMRTSTGRRVGTSRGVVINPFGSAKSCYLHNKCVNW